MNYKYRLFKPYVNASAAAAVSEVLFSGFIGEGPVNKKFESALKEKIGNDFVATVNSATSAEYLAWLLLERPNEKFNWEGLKPGDTVLSCPLTCFATHVPILLRRFNIQWVDVDPLTLNIDLEDLARKVTKNTRAIQIVHWGGSAVDLTKVREIQRYTRNNLGFSIPVVEDAAHSWGAILNGKHIGNHGNLTTFSFQAIKSLTTGDGGCLVSPHSDLHRRAKLLKWYGMDRETDSHSMRCYEDVSEVGSKFHMNDINSAIGLSNLQTVDWVVNKQRDNAAYYTKELTKLGIKLPQIVDGADPSYWIYSFLVEDRDNFSKMMKEKGIETSQVHERNDKYSCVKQFKSYLPGLDYVTPRLTAIPNGYWIDEEAREEVINAIRAGW